MACAAAHGAWRRLRLRALVVQCALVGSWSCCCRCSLEKQLKHELKAGDMAAMAWGALGADGGVAHQLLVRVACPIFAYISVYFKKTK